MSHRLPTRKVHSLIHKSLPPSQRQLYYHSLKKFLSSQLTKSQWDKVLKSVAASCGNEIITLHNCLIKCILYNAREVAKGSLTYSMQSLVGNHVSNESGSDKSIVSSKSSSLLVLFRDVNSIGISSGVSETGRSVNIWNGFGDWIGSGIKYEGLLGKKSCIVGITPYGVLPQTHYGNCSLTGQPIPKETSTGQISTFPADRPPLNLLSTSNTRILSSEGLLPSLPHHPEMYTSIFAPRKRLEKPFHSKYQDVLPFDFGSKGWTQTSFLYGSLSSALSLPSSRKFHCDAYAGSSFSAETSLQRDFPDLSIVHRRMQRIAKAYQVGLPIPCVHMVIRAMESYIKTIIENCINAKRQDELEKIHRTDKPQICTNISSSEEDPEDHFLGTYLTQSKIDRKSMHSYYHYKDEYEQMYLKYKDNEFIQHPKVNRIITTKCLLSVLQMKPHLFSGNSEWTSRIREKVLHSNWDLPFEE